MSVDKRIQEAVALGEANKRVLELAQNWCMHLRVELRGGVGLVELSTGLPVGMRAITCPYSRAAGIAAMDLKAVALDFYDRNCVGCLERKPVRLPNLSELVAKRDNAAREQEAETERFRSEEALKLAERRRKRVERQRGADEARLGLYDALDRLDENQAKEDGDVLEQIAQAAPEKFTPDLVESLLEVADAGGWGRTDGTLRTLAAVAIDSARLGAIALGAFARGDSVSTASSIVAGHLLPEHRDLVGRALWHIIKNAAPSRTIGLPLTHIPRDPAALVATFRLFPDLVYGALTRMLASRLKGDRIDACEGLLHLVDIHPSLGLQLAPVLISSLQLPDDGYEGGPAAGAVERVLALTMRALPNEIDTVVQEAMNTSGNESTRAALMDVYVQFLHSRWPGEPRVRTDYDPIAFRRILAVLLDRQADERLRVATDFLCYPADAFPDLLAAQAEILLGAAAMLNEALAESIARSLILDRALNAPWRPS